ncbi:MAG: hypothetical protein GOVbin1630_46 [Prokaryotic dsDNA virus sp.]|nr:MAG: hypothetical protein GOVbin1630_46 [Prokaryotic dsDNA virus sp.]
MPSWKTSGMERDLGSLDTRVLLNGARGLSVVILDIARDHKGDDLSDLEYVAYRLELLLNEFEARLRVIDELRNELRILQAQI